MSGDAFDFYPCLVDGKPASIYLNLRFETDRPAGADTRYCIGIHMRDAGPHGVGTAEEAETLNAFEEQAIATLTDLVYAGRVRTAGLWEIAFYGSAGHAAAVRKVLERMADRRTELRVERDPEWRYYVDLLLPDAERLQWMDDRRMVQILREQGDVSATPRRVDHWATFATSEARDAFIRQVAAAGFELDAASDDGEGDRRFGAHVYREDTIELDHIHDVVMTVVDAARECGGEYDGWETSIEHN